VDDDARESTAANGGDDATVRVPASHAQRLQSTLCPASTRPGGEDQDAIAARDGAWRTPRVEGSGRELLPTEVVECNYDDLHMTLSITFAFVANYGCGLYVRGVLRAQFCIG
jgi:hypothetical protein